MASIRYPRCSQWITITRRACVVTRRACVVTRRACSYKDGDGCESRKWSSKITATHAVYRHTAEMCCAQRTTDTGDGAVLVGGDLFLIPPPPPPPPSFFAGRDGFPICSASSADVKGGSPRSFGTRWRIVRQHTVRSMQCTRHTVHEL